MFKKSLLAVFSALSLAWAVPASAALVVSFDPTGAGSTATKIDVLDPTVGNSIALGANALTGVGASVTALFQANLGIATLGGVTQFTNGAGGNFFTIVAGFHETLLANSGGAFPTLVLGLNGAQPSFFDVYKVPTTADNDLATNFIVGAPILSGVFINSGAPGDGISNFTVTGSGAPLDGFNGDDTPLTLTGIGAFSTTVLILTRNPGYFPDLVPGSTLALVTSELKLNYSTVDPSDCFSTNGTTNCNQPGVTAVGTINAFNGPNTMFQTDASAAFAAAPPVPEPATLTLLGIGLIAGARRRMKTTKK